MFKFLELFSPQTWGFIALAAALWTGGVYWYADSNGYDRADNSWIIKTDALKLEAARVKAASDERVKGFEQNIRDLNSDLEKAHADKLIAIAADHDATIAAINAGGVLIDKKGRGYCRTNVVPSSNGAVVHSEPTPVIGCELSSQTSRDLTDLVRDAADTADFANKCRTWAMTVPMLCKN